MFLFLIDGSLSAILVLLAYFSPLLIIGFIIYSFVKGREKPVSITDWKNPKNK